jgi:acetoin utilization deacetylase AcuC-like enzyme
MMIVTVLLGSVLAGPVSAGAEMSSTTAGAAGTAFVYDPIYLEHLTGTRHPEGPQRLSSIVTLLEETGLLETLLPLKPRTDVEQWITSVHDKDYVSHVRELCGAGAKQLDTGDTPICSDSYEVGCAAVGGVLAAVDAVMEGRARNAFCAVRPPGHHATPTRGMGFCIFNNVAIAARYIQKHHNLKRVLIVDWDVHHGNGTQETFYRDGAVLYFSTHQYPFYPGTGSAEERGDGAGRGFIINVPLAAETSEEEFIRVYKEKLQPEALRFRPDFVLISAGFDAHRDDLLGSLQMTEEGFAKVTRLVKEIAQECCQGRLVSVLEGGYNLKALARSVEAHIRALQEPPSKK